MLIPRLSELRSIRELSPNALRHLLCVMNGLLSSASKVLLVIKQSWDIWESHCLHYFLIFWFKLGEILIEKFYIIMQREQPGSYVKKEVHKKNNTERTKQNENVSQFSTKNAKGAKYRKIPIKRDSFHSTTNDCYYVRG